MAKKRMFCIDVVDSDAFLDMPLSAQALYFHLGMRADDEGFVSSARKIQRTVGAADDDFKLLLAKRFLLPCDAGIIVIKHWYLNNAIRADRAVPTLYQEQRARLYKKQNGVYTDHAGVDCLPLGIPNDNQLPADCQPNVNQMSTNCQPNDNQNAGFGCQSDNQVPAEWLPSGCQVVVVDKVSIDKSSLEESSIDQGREEKILSISLRKKEKKER